MKILRSSCSIGAIIPFLLALQPLRLEAQCPALCGDLTGSGMVTSADLLEMYQYLSQETPSPSVNGCADVDDRSGITMRDASLLFEAVFWGGSLDCDLDSGAYVPLADSAAWLHYNHLIPPNDSVVTVRFELSLPFPSWGVSLPMRVTVDSASTVFGQVELTAPTSGPAGHTWTKASFRDSKTADVPTDVLLACKLMFAGSIEADRHSLGTAELLVESSTSYRTITVELVEWPPGHNTAMVAQWPTWQGIGRAVELKPASVLRTGDVNHDGVLSSSDIIVVVNYVFKSGASPYPVAAAADANCSGSVGSADIITMVNYVFKSGTEPCDVETECAVNLDQWTCP